MLPYDLRLTGLNAPDARITGAFFAAGNGVPSPIDPSGSVVMTLPDGTEFQNYVFLLQAHVTQKTANGEPVETDVEFTFLLRLESGLDLDLRLAWQTTSAPAEATCGANNTTTRTVKSDTLTDGLFQYSFDFLGESARTAEFVSADYRAGDGETGTLSQSGVLQMSPADGQDQETYFLSVTARASGQTVRYSFVLTYEDGLDLQLKFSWLERSVTRRDTLCAANGGASLTIKHNQLKDGLLQYQLALTGRSADQGRHHLRHARQHDPEHGSGQHPAPVRRRRRILHDCRHRRIRRQNHHIQAPAPLSERCQPENDLFRA